MIPIERVQPLEVFHEDEWKPVTMGQLEVGDIVRFRTEAETFYKDEETGYTSFKVTQVPTFNGEWVA